MLKTSMLPFSRITLKLDVDHLKEIEVTHPQGNILQEGLKVVLKLGQTRFAANRPICSTRFVSITIVGRVYDRKIS